VTAVLDSRPRPQDRLVLREGAVPFDERRIPERSVALWTVLSLSLIGYFVWYFRAQRDCERLMDATWDRWMWMAMLFPGMILVLPYAAAQAKMVARVEVATREPLGTMTYLAVCCLGFFVPALLPLVLQRRLNRAARLDPAHLRQLRRA
jgi:hypothetical protein